MTASSKKRLFVGLGITLLFVLMFAAAVVFLLASSVPDEYKPFQLTQKERKDAAIDFVGRHGAKLVENIRVNQPFSHTLTEQDMNLYLASLDEIAYLKPARRGNRQKSGEVYEAMDKAGLADPVVAMDDGILTVMVRTQRSNKVASMDLAFEFPDNDHIQIVLKQVRIGHMPVPRSFVEGGLETLKRGVGDLSTLDETAAQDLDTILAGVLAAVGEGPLPATMRFGSKRVRRIKDVVVDDGQLTIHVEPAFDED
jgi:hypothetical protein